MGHGRTVSEGAMAHSQLCLCTDGKGVIAVYFPSIIDAHTQSHTHTHHVRMSCLASRIPLPTPSTPFHDERWMPASPAGLSVCAGRGFEMVRGCGRNIRRIMAPVVDSFLFFFPQKKEIPESRARIKLSRWVGAAKRFCELGWLL